MSELIERVARKVGDTLHACGKFDNPSGDPWTDGPSILAARAAIAEVLDAVAERLKAIPADKAALWDMNAMLHTLRREAMGEG